jgi:hypothetical protein
MNAACPSEKSPVSPVRTNVPRTPRVVIAVKTPTLII